MDPQPPVLETPSFNIIKINDRLNAKGEDVYIGVA